MYLTITWEFTNSPNLILCQYLFLYDIYYYCMFLPGTVVAAATNLDFYTEIAI